LTGKRRVSFVFNGVEALPDLDISDNTPYITRNEKWKNIFNENGAFRQVSCCQPSV
jgi:hypothetical protein